MEYVEGDTVAHLLARAAQKQVRLPVEVTLRIALDAIAGLDAAHELKDDHDQPLHVVHRDVSPQNILVGVDGTTRITDFGVARAAARLTTTRTGQLKGKLAYMAPEQAKGQDVDRRADIFALGIVLWEALAMKRLFKGDGEAETLSRVMNEPIAPLRSIVPTLPASIEAVVMRALERDPAKRFATAAELGEALEKAGRAVRSVGTHKDVSVCLDAHMGPELAEQRSAVRSWMALSEPSRVAKRPDSPSQPGSGPRLTANEASGPNEASRPSQRSGEGEASARRASVTPGMLEVTAPSGASVVVQEASAPPPPLSAPTSVSAASLSALTEHGASESPPAPAKQRWPSMVAAAVLGGALVALLLKFGAPSTPAKVAGAPAQPPQAPVEPQTPAPPTPPTPSSALSVATATPSASASVVAAAAPKGSPTTVSVARPTSGRPAVAPHGPPRAQPSAPPPSKPIPDDISNNPYR